MLLMEATDLYLTVGRQPSLRIGQKIELIDQPPLTGDDLESILGQLLTSRQRREYDTNNELNISLDLSHLGRFRANFFRQKMQPGIVIRRIVSKIPSFDQLRLPALLQKLALLPRGLILVTGMTGSGKSTTLASMVDYRNKHASGHVITIEDPVEYYHEHHQSIITQREVGIDTESYEVALKNTLRQRPDVILIGEIRDSTVMNQVLFASETGHLCFSTLHASNAYQSLERILGLFDDEQSKQVRQSLAMNLRAIICQRLLPSLKGDMVVATEILINEGHIRDLIMEGEFHKIRDVIEQNTVSGMHSFQQCLLDLVRQNLISEEIAIQNADVPGDMKLKIQQLKMGTRGQKAASTIAALDTSKLTLTE
ncbi:MAG: PilT/PilU family type 4a pilus ATPase [Alphaproteobacteria bacterium]|nr:PilT/PilU family type 4a pilus ATPase [Alphaproteobacteria bacterium]